MNPKKPTINCTANTLLIMITHPKHLPDAGPLRSVDGQAAPHDIVQWIRQAWGQHGGLPPGDELQQGNPAVQTVVQI